MNIGKHMVAQAAGQRWLVYTKKGALLGTIEWGQWDQYEFVPQFGTMFTSDCLRAMAAKLEELTAQRLGREAGRRGA